MSNVLDLARIAASGLLRRKVRSYLTILGIFIGIAAIVSLISLGQGLQTAVLESFSGFGPDLLFVTAKSPGFGPPGAASVASLDETDIAVVEDVSGVAVAAKRTIRSARIAFKDRIDVTFVTNIPDDPKARDLVLGAFRAQAAQGRLIEPNEGRRVTVGSRFGDDDSPLGQALAPGKDITINDVEFKVVGVLKRTGQPTGARVILMPEAEFERLFDARDEVGGIAVRVQPGADPVRVAEDISKALRQHRNLETGREDFDIQTPASLLESVNTVLTIVQAVLVGIGAISLLVGGIGVMNTMYTAVLERIREIGVMKAIGGRNSDIFTLFFLESGMLGTVGGVIGIMLGIALSKSVEIISTQLLGTTLVQVQYSVWLITGALAFSFVVGSISGTLPALQAAKIPPVEALRQ